MVCPWSIHGVCMVCAWSVHGMSMACAWYAHGLSMVCPQSGLFFAPSLLSSFFFVCPMTMMLMLALMLPVSQIACMYAQEVWGTLHAGRDLWTCRPMDGQTMDDQTMDRIGGGGGLGRPPPLFASLARWTYQRQRNFHNLLF